MTTVFTIVAIGLVKLVALLGLAVGVATMVDAIRSKKWLWLLGGFGWSVLFAIGILV